MPSLPPNMCDISAYALFSQILSFILLTWKQNFWLILMLLNPERDKNTNLDINYKAFVPYNNHWFYIEKKWFWPFLNWQLYVSYFYGQEWNSRLWSISISSKHPLDLRKTQTCQKKTCLDFLLDFFVKNVSWSCGNS